MSYSNLFRCEKRTLGSHASKVEAALATPGRCSRPLRPRKGKLGSHVCSWVCHAGLAHEVSVEQVLENHEGVQESAARGVMEEGAFRRGLRVRAEADGPVSHLGVYR